MDGNKSGVELATGLCKFNVLAVEGVCGDCVILMSKDRWGEESCVEAKKKEIAMWERFGVIELVEDDSQQLRVLMKWIVTQEEMQQGETEVKAVIMKNMEQDLLNCQTKSTTCGKEIVRLMSSLAAMKEHKMVWKMKDNIYGLRDAAVKLRRRGLEHLVMIGGKVSAVDSCLVLFQKVGKSLGVVALWVDDCFVVGEVEFTKYIQERMLTEFMVGRVVGDEFKCLGIHAKLAANGTFMQTLLDYIEGLREEEVSVGDDKKYLDEYGLTVNRVGQEARLQLCFVVVELNVHFKEGVVGHIKEVDKCVKVQKGKSR